jgi:hypothetical protein
VYKPRPSFMPFGFRAPRMPNARSFREHLSSGNPASEQVLRATRSVLLLAPVA